MFLVITTFALPTSAQIILLIMLRNTPHSVYSGHQKHPAKQNKNRYIDQWNITENLDINPHTYGQVIFDNLGRNTHWRKDSTLNK